MEPIILNKEGQGNEEDPQIHLLKPGIICDTEARGHKTPQGKSPFELIVDASEGFIPLWAKDTTLRWRIRERSLSHLANADEMKTAIRELLGKALLAWGDAVPIKFSEDNDVWDFEIVMKRGDECSNGGCVLASAFFPDAGRHSFFVYPMMFRQSANEQVDTFVHELGHVFGLRHFFATISETAWPSEAFGAQNEFTIMNYGNLSELSEADKSDLKLLYQQAWSGALTNINGTPIKFVKPFHTLNEASNNLTAEGELSLAAKRQ